MEQTAVSHSWLIETLGEVRKYAARNGLPALAEHLEQAIHLAHIEQATLEGQGSEGKKRSNGENGPDDQSR